MIKGVWILKQYDEELYGEPVEVFEDEKKCEDALFKASFQYGGSYAMEYFTITK